MYVLTFCVHLYTAGFYHYVIPTSNKTSEQASYVNPWDYKDEQYLVLPELTACILTTKV